MYGWAAPDRNKNVRRDAAAPWITLRILSMNSTRFWLIRHGETQWNAERRLQGWQDIPLSDIGIRQAEHLRTYLMSPSFGDRIDTIVSSDLCRAYDTAQIATAHYGLAIERHDGLRERCYGIYEGCDWASLNGPSGESVEVNFRDPEQAVDQGETLPQFYDRVIGAFETLAQRHTGKNVLVFSHGGVIDIAWRAANRIALDTPRPAPILNTSINQFAIDANKHWHPLEWGRSCHLPTEALDDVI